jgi:hypothetical protein
MFNPFIIFLQFLLVFDIINLKDLHFLWFYELFGFLVVTWL